MGDLKHLRLYSDGFVIDEIIGETPTMINVGIFQPRLRRDLRHSNWGIAGAGDNELCYVLKFILFFIPL